jgi:hypothetical protein
LLAQDLSGQQYVLQGVHLLVYPNPSTQTFTLQFSSKEISSVDLRVLDAQGRVVEQRRVTSGATINLGENYRPGLYVAEVRQGNKTISVKLIKQAK